MHPTCPSTCSVNGTIWTCSSGVARFIDNKAISVFQHHCTHLASFVSVPIPVHLCPLSSESHLHFGEGTFLRVELCQRSSHSLHVSVNQLPYEPIRFTGMGSDRHQQIVAERHMDLGEVVVDAVVQWQEASFQHAPYVA